MNCSVRSVLPFLLYPIFILGVPLSHARAADVKVGKQSPPVRRHAEARLSVSLVETGKYEQARELLLSLTDADFVLPARREIRDVLEDGTLVCEIVPPRGIGNRGLLLAECCFHLDKREESARLIWELLEANSTDQKTLYFLLRLHQEEDYASSIERLRSLEKRYPKNSAVVLAQSYLKVAHSLKEGDFRPAIQAIRSGAWARDSEGGPAAELKEWVSRELAKTTDKSLGHLLKALEENEQPTWIIYCLGLSKDSRAIPALQRCRERIKNWWARKEIDTAVARLQDASREKEDDGKPSDPVDADKPRR